MPAYLTRVGVFAYKRADGKTVREYRPAEEVFKTDSLATLSSAPVTDLHPTRMVDPTNVKQLRVGHVGEAVRKDGHRVAAQVTVEDAEVIAKVESGTRREISCGYQCRIDATPGTYNGEAYDVVQRDIVYNHAALGPRGWGRQGGDVALRVDSNEQQGDEQVFRLDAGDAVSATTHSAPSERKDEDDDMDMVTIRLDGIDAQVPKTSAQLIEKVLGERSDAASEAKKALDTLQAKFDALTAEHDKVKKQFTEASDPKRLDSAVNERATLLEQARRVLPAEHKFDGKSTRQVQVDVLTKLDDKLDLKEKSDEYVQARFDAAIAALPAKDEKRSSGGSERNDALDQARKHTSGGGNNSSDRKDSAPVNRNDGLAEWQQPLAYSKDA